MWVHTWLQAPSRRGSLALPWHHWRCELQVFRVVQPVAWRPAPGFCSDPSGLPASSLEEMGNSCFELQLYIPAAELVLQYTAKMLLLLTGGVCFWGRISCYWGADVQWILSSIHCVCGSASLLVLCGRSWGTVVVGWGQGWLLPGRERQDATHGEEGGRGNCKWNPPPVAVEAGPPCTVYNSRVQSGVYVCLPGIQQRCCVLAFSEKERVWLTGAGCCPCPQNSCSGCLLQETNVLLPLVQKPWSLLMRASAPLNSRKKAFGESQVGNMKKWVPQQGGKTRRGNFCLVFLPIYVNQQ